MATNIDVNDIRVNELNAYVLADATTLYPGETFRSHIVMAAVDTTMRPEIYVNGKREYFKGVNTQDIHPLLGHAIDVPTMLKDVPPYRNPHTTSPSHPSTCTAERVRLRKQGTATARRNSPRCI